MTSLVITSSASDFDLWSASLHPLSPSPSYLAIWRVYVTPLDPSLRFAVRLLGASYLYYGWFVAGIIGLTSLV